MGFLEGAWADGESLGSLGVRIMPGMPSSFFFFYSFFNSSTLLSIHISELHNILRCGTRLWDVRGGPWPLGPGCQGVSDMRLSWRNEEGLQEIRGGRV